MLEMKLISGYVSFDEWQSSLYAKAEKEGGADYRYLAINTGSSTSIPSTYIVFVTKMQKSKPSKKDLPLLENDITGSEATFKTTDT